MSEINRKYKDRLFNFIFGSEENRAWTLSLYNAINHGHNKELLDACRPLREYSWLIHEIRSNLKIEDTNIEKAVDKAIKEMPGDFIIKPFLDAHRAEVRDMLLTEYNEEEVRKLFIKDGVKIGVDIGVNKLADLIQILIKTNRSEEIDRATSDQDYRNLLFKEFNL